MAEPIDRLETMEQLADIIFDKPSGDYFKGVASAQPFGTDTNVATTDTISRQAAIDEIKAVYEWHDTVTVDRLIQHFKALPSAQQWIPCSVRLPEESMTYLCSCKNGIREVVTFAKWMPRLKSWNLTGSRAYWHVVAWCELPAPYKGG